jgi:hypothetical protein
MNARRLLAGALLGGLAAGCTPVAWQHASLGVAPSQAELGECNQSAYLEAQRQAFFYGYGYGYGPGWPRYTVDRFGRFRYDPWARYAYNDRFFLERDLFDYCMRAKGYRLVEVSTAAKPSE